MPSSRNIGALIAIVLLACGESAGRESPRAGQLFAEGKRLVERNCGECYGATREQLEQGIELLSKALEEGYPDQASAYALLGEAFGIVAHFHARSDSEEQILMLERQREAFAKMVEASPEDAEALYTSALVMTSDDERLEAYRRVLELDPDHLQARFWVARSEAQADDEEKGIATMIECFERAAGWEKLNLGRHIVRFLDELGRNEEAAAFGERVKLARTEELSAPPATETETEEDGQPEDQEDGSASVNGPE